MLDYNSKIMLFPQRFLQYGEDFAAGGRNTKLDSGGQSWRLRLKRAEEDSWKLTDNNNKNNNNHLLLAIAPGLGNEKVSPSPFGGHLWGICEPKPVFWSPSPGPSPFRSQSPK